MIPVMKPKLPSFDLVSKYLRSIDESRIYSNFGPLVKTLESRYAEYLGVQENQVVAFSNATMAIQGCVEISEVKQWVVPNYTFAATAHSVLQARKQLLLVDVSLADWKIDTCLIPLGQVGIIPVMPFGCTVNLADYFEWDSVVVDAAASLGAPLIGAQTMKPTHFVIYSLHATKVLGAGEGAIIVCGSAEYAQKLRSWANFGFVAARSSSFIATNAKMTEITASYGLASLDQREAEEYEWVEALTAKNRLVLEAGISNISDIYLGFRPYWIHETHGDVELLSKYLEDRGIGTRTWWPIPLSEMPAFCQAPLIGENKNAKRLSSAHIGLPFWREIPLSLIDKIVSELQIYRQKLSMD